MAITTQEQQNCRHVLSVSPQINTVAAAAACSPRPRIHHIHTKPFKCRGPMWYPHSSKAWQCNRAHVAGTPQHPQVQISSGTHQRMVYMLINHTRLSAGHPHCPTSTGHGSQPPLATPWLGLLEIRETSQDLHCN